MPYSVSTWITSTTAAYVVEDIYLKGGYRIVADMAARDSIVFTRMKVGMLVFVQSDSTMWQLSALDATTNTPTWVPFSVGGGGSGGLPSRKTYTYTTNVIPAGASEPFITELGKTITILKLAVTVPELTVEAHSTPLMTDTNPYTFKSGIGQLEDDGSTLLADMTREYGRRYTILSNLEDPPTKYLYWKITNTSTASVTVTLTLLYLDMEA